MSDADIAITTSDERLLSIDEALNKLAGEDPQAAELVKLRYFAGFSISQAAEALGISRTTAYEQWAYARAWLRCEVEGERLRNPQNHDFSGRSDGKVALLSGERHEQPIRKKPKTSSLSSSATYRQMSGKIAWLKQVAVTQELLRRVRALLRAHAEPGSFLEEPAVANQPAPTLDQPITEKPGTQIGPYKLLQQIGEGGMGVVYMAEQKEPVKRRVALKIIKPGMDTRQVIARFEAERQALAMMDHPNIAKVLDAGQTESGRPYFVMELVKGMPVTKYCDEQHLTPKERLELFVPICQAVQHAHQKGIIHRDLKPSNILVALYDGQAVPKIIDFGVAKATSQTLTEKTMFTQVGQVVGTLEYMAPEQAQRNQLDVDTRSDIYSLGVVLYELLTGETPFDRERLRSAAFDEMLRIIREEEPSKPSTKVSSSQSLPSIAANRRIEPAKLGSMIRGELDWIVLKAMEKDRGRRYETASKFAEDVQHYLNDEAVVACPPSRAYKFRKFARRNKVPVTLAGMALFALVSLAVSGFLLASYFESQAQRQREITDQRAIADARLKDALSNLEAAIERAEAARLSDDGAWFAAQQARQPAKVLVAVETANQALVNRVRGLDEWFEQFERDRTLLDRLSRIRLAQANSNILENRFATENALPEYAELFADEGLDLSRLSAREAAKRLAHRRMEVRSALVAALCDSRGIGESTDHPLKMQAKKLLQVLEDEKSDALGSNGKVLSGTDDLHDLAEEVESAELAVARQTPYDLSAMGKVLCERAEYWETGIDLLRQAQRQYPNDFWINHELGTRLASRSAHRQEGVEYLQVAVALRPDSAGPRLNLGTAPLQLKRRREAVAVYRKAIEIEPSYRIAHRQLGIALRELGEWDQAVDEFRQALELDPDGLETSYIYAHMGFALMKQGKLDECIQFCRKSLELNPNETVALTALAMAFLKQGKLEESSELLHKALNVDANNSVIVGNLGFLLQEQGRFAEAITQHREAIAIDPENSEAYNNLGICLKEQDKLEEAIGCYRKAIELDPGSSLAFNNLAAALLGQGKNEEAVACLRQAIELAPKDAEFHVNLGLALASQGKLDEAVTFHQQAITIKPEYARAHVALGNAMMELGKPVEEIECYRQAIKIAETGENLKPIDLCWPIQILDLRYSVWGMKTRRSRIIARRLTLYQLLRMRTLALELPCQKKATTTTPSLAFVKRLNLIQLASWDTLIWASLKPVRVTQKRRFNASAKCSNTRRTTWTLCTICALC